MTFADILNQLYENDIRQELTENRKTYKQMMQGVIGVYQKYAPDQIPKIERIISGIQKTYKRSDRIIWALRWLRYNLVLELKDYISALPEDEKDTVSQWIEKTTKKLENEFISKGSIDPYVVQETARVLTSNVFINSMVHYMAYTDRQSDNYIAAIDDYQFLWQTPNTVITDLSKFEYEWKETRSRELEHASTAYEGAEKIIDFPDGFAWWNTNESSCSKEGSAMGHCGNNQGSRNPHDKLLSLRQDVTRGGNTYQIPYLTFILDEDGYLGEMKGRNNQKPSEKYFPYIVALLKSKYVDGIKGGGYDPANNFHISDLPNNVRDELISINPDFETFSDKADRYISDGDDDGLETAIWHELNDNGLPGIYSVDISKKIVILDHWDNINQLSREVDFIPLINAIQVKDYFDDGISDEKISDIIDDIDINSGMIIEILKYLPDQYVQRIADDLGIKDNIHKDNTYMKIADNIKNSKYDEPLRQSIGKTSFSEKNINKKKYYKYISLLIDVVTDYNTSSYKTLNKNDNGSYSLISNLYTFINEVSKFTNNNDEDGYYSEYDVIGIQTASFFSRWFYTENDRSYSDWRNIINGNIKYTNYVYNDIKLMQKYNKLINHGTGITVKDIKPQYVAEEFQKYIDTNESKEINDNEFSTQLTEMKRLAGIRI